MKKKVKPLLPVPKVLLPSLAGVVGIAATWVATGHFDREQLGALVLLAGYALIGYSAPSR